MSAQRPDRISAAHGIAVRTTAVVVGVDDSETSWDAFWWACGEVRRLNGHLLAVFVSPIPLADAGATAACATFAGVVVPHVIADRKGDEHASRLRHRIEQAAAEAGVDVTFMHASGDATNELLRIAQEEHADVIVIGRSTKARHHVAGSLGRRLIGKRDVPVVVVVP
jgi:nucleotide-binding universal stress UspA family protein